MDPNGSQWIPIDSNRSQCIPIDPNGSQWILLDPIGSQYIRAISVTLYMGQKDQDGYNAEKCHFFFQLPSLNTPI